MLPSDGAAADVFGWSISISGDYAVVGTYWDDDNGTDAGSAYLYTGFATAVGVGPERTGLPAEFYLSQNYPNPFNPVTTIRYDLPEASRVNLTIYGLTGREVMRWDLQESPGFKQLVWDGKDRGGRLVPTGLYIYRMVATSAESDERFVESRKMVLLK